MNLTLPALERGGCSGDARPTGPRWRLTDLPSPSRRDACSEEQARPHPVPLQCRTRVQEGALPLPKGRGLRAEGCWSVDNNVPKCVALSGVLDVSERR
jgi:hypothetical protein